MNLIKKYIYVFITALAFTACDKNLEVENINRPDSEDVLSSPEGVRAVASGLFQQWYFIEQHNLDSPGPAMWVMADWGTVNFANYGTRDMSEEPRIFLNNTPSYAYQDNYRDFWRKMYGIITSANDVIKGIDNGLIIETNSIDETMMVKGFAKFVQGIGNGYLGLTFDKTYPSDENTDYTVLEQAGYQISIDMAIEQLKEAIEIFENNEFILPDGWMNGNVFSNDDMAKLSHSFIARLMTYAPRNKEQTAALNWNEILDHVNKGITEDFNIEADGKSGNWMPWMKYYMGRPGWGKLDMRVVNMIDPKQPANWPGEKNTEDLANQGKIISKDLRVDGENGGDKSNDYFSYDPSNNRPERGYFRWSSYRQNRFDDLINANFYGPVIMMRKVEMEMIAAEANLILNNKAQAISIVNSSTRITKGGLDLIDANADVETVMAAIEYEQTLELGLTGFGIEYFNMRRHGMLQDGSLLHFPMPAQQSDILLLPRYTFGGISPQYGEPNEDVAIDGWYNPTTR
ncbi:MAG: RagB/SusD family nutrient uptake outer membrane protein [Flavobacteriales bacterium]|nr:RagB/SusD family nutrient uptake outer membrane protein [Flavobacteriales bacterium]